MSIKTDDGFIVSSYRYGSGNLPGFIADADGNILWGHPEYRKSLHASLRARADEIADNLLATETDPEKRALIEQRRAEYKAHHNGEPT